MADDGVFGKPSLLLQVSKPAAPPSPPTFVPNGLLGGLRNSLDQPEIGDNVDRSDSSILGAQQTEAKSTFEFKPNGLLGLSASQDSSTATQPSSSSVSNSQDDDFPTISDLLRAHPTPAGHSAGRPTSEILPTFMIKANSYDGKPVFIKKKSLADRARKRIAVSTGAIGNLLDVPIHRLMDELAVSTAETINTTVVVAEQAHTSTSQSDCDLWVDRYRPQRYTDLLGDDRVHREVMAWVKEWDWCVFGKSKGKKKASLDEEYQDEYRRPREKFLLLSGPPGLGKTTLAHIAAQQAGYKVFEINASDARSGQVVDERIRPALESGSAVGSSKPVLVVIDEIDGATGAGDTSSGFVQKLIQLTQNTSKKKRRKGEDSKRPILRPIICICNDLYASSLAKLRPHARIVRLCRPPDVHLVKRLRDICECESLKAESRALSTLVGIAQGDLRGCLNTLQFIKGRGAIVTEVVVRKATIGMKETEASQLTVLNDLFAPMSKKRVKELGYGEEEESRYVARLSREVDSTGNPDKVALGCFEHYANLHKHDGTFSRYEKAMDWLGSYDLMSGEMRTEREYSIIQYLPFMVVPFYSLFQERGAQRVERPKADWENYVSTRSHEEIYKSLARCVRSASSREHGNFRHLVSDQILRLEFSPYINRILSPPLRPVNSQIIKPEERAVLSRLVDLMVALDLRFVQDKAEDGQLIYRLDPPIDAFVTYDGKRASDIAISRYAVRQLVATEVEARIIARQAESVQARKPSKQFFGKRSREDAAVGEESQSNKRAKLDMIDIADRPATDFFGRLITIPVSSTKPASSAKPASKRHGISYKFHEGNSSAVRKPVKVASFT